MDEIFGKFVTLIHPFDYYDKSLSYGNTGKELGFIGIPVNTEDCKCYLSSAKVVELFGTTYVITTTVEPSPSASLK